MYGINNTITQTLVAELRESAIALCKAPKINAFMAADVFKSTWLETLLFSEDENATTAWVKNVVGTPFKECNLTVDGVIVAVVPAMAKSTSNYFNKNFDVTTHYSRIKSAQDSSMPYRVIGLYNDLVNAVQENPFPLEDLKQWVTLAEYFGVNPPWLNGFKIVIAKSSGEDIKTSLPRVQIMTASLIQFNPNNLTIAVTGDNHIGHPNTCSIKILKAIISIVPDSEESRSLDLLVINGDLFDNPMMMTSPYRGDIIITFYELLKRCKKYDIVLRVLEGTPSHDYRQSKIFDDLNKGIMADCKYIDSLSIEYNERYNSYWLFVPDEWRASALETSEDVTALLSANKIKSVDYAFMHGYFNYQLPDIATDEAHDISFYSDIVKYNIFINHVHTFSQNGKVTAPGSIERLSHNEEGDKGYILRDKNNVKFIINKESNKYITIDCTGMELESAFAKVDKIASVLPKGSFIRIKSNKNDPILHSVSFFKTEYPTIGWTSIRADKKDAKTIMDTPVVKAASKIPNITKDNIVSFLQPRLLEKNPALATRCLQLLEETINAK